MAASNLLNITQIAADQSNKYLTHNNAVDALEQSINEVHVEAAIGAGPEAISETEASRNGVFELSGGSANFDVTFPSTINAVNTSRVYFINNLDTVYTATIKASSGSGANVTLKPEESAVVYQDFEDIYLLSQPNPGTGIPYDIGMFFPGIPAASAVMLKLTMARAVNFADDFAGSVGNMGTNPADGTLSLDVEVNGTAIGNIDITTGGVFTFATDATTLSLAVGDEIEIVNNATPDSAASNFSITLLGTRG